jgi:choline monooxygenase
VFVGHVSQLREAGDFVCGHAGDQSVVVVRQADGALKGFHNVCQHRAHPLLEGEGRGRRLIVCPYHAWSYDIAGGLVRAPGSEAMPGFAPGDFGLAEVRVEVMHGLVLANCDASATPLARQAPNLVREIGRHFPDLATYERIGTIRHDMRMNWKVRIDNSLECYHCQPVHKSFCEIVDMGDYHTTTDTVFSTQIGRSKAPPPGKAEAHVVYWYLWPLTELNADTGTGMFGVFHNRPVAPDRTIMTLNLFAPPGIAPEERKEILDTWLENETNAEDLRLGEAVQEGVTSMGYRQGRFVVDRSRHYSEHAVHHFHRLVSAALELPREA